MLGTAIPGDPHAGATGAALEHHRKRSVPGWISVRVGLLGGAVCNLAAWPAGLWSAMSTQAAGGPVPFARVALRPGQVIASAWSLGMALLTAGLMLATGIHWYLLVMAWFLILANAARQLGSVLPGNGNTMTALRNRPQNPALQLGLITAADFLTLTVAAVVLLRWPARIGLLWSALLAEGRNIWGFGHLGAILRVHPQGADQVLVAVAALLLYASLLKFVRPDVFRKRNASESTTIALSYLLVGEPEKAERWLSVLDSPIRDPNAVSARGAYKLAVGDLEAALVLARRYVELEWADVGPQAREEDALARLTSWSRTCADHPGYPTTAGMLSFAIDHGATDGVLVYCVACTSKGKWRTVESSVREALSQADPAGERFPMALAMTDVQSSRFVDARKRLAGLRPASVNDQLVGRFIAAMSKLASAYAVGDRIGAFLAVSDLAGGIEEESAGWPVDDLARWQRQWMADVLFFYQATARKLRSKEDARDLQRVRFRLVGEVEGSRNEGYLGHLWRWG